MLLPIIILFRAVAAFGFVNIELPELPNIELPEIPNPIKEMFLNKCITDLGCFYTGPPFYHFIHRPISLTPSSDLDTKIRIFTNEGEQETLNPELPTKVLIHGYLSDMDEDDIRYQMKDALLENDDYNIVVVDWSANNRPPYVQAVANARAVAVQVVNFLKAKDFDPERTHIIGHSLGAQMAGWIGERIPNLDRITGLDPAGPFFQNADNQVRLDRTDANFVDIIHTDAGANVLVGLGIEDPIGHVDFYPNGGRHQPGCPIYTSNRETISGAVVNVTTQFIARACDHGRANELFLESIKNNTCQFLAVKCESYSDFEKGLCPRNNSMLDEMGILAEKIQGQEENKFFLRTNEESPFCLQDSIDL